MANDPNRDLLPVKESWKVGKGIYDKFDYQILGKLSRCELEDRFLRLLDEQTHIKKLANSQEEKIKRLGTKLLRLLNEKKIGRKVLGQVKSTEDLELRIIELEHENYALKDKNTVLKQQLSSHTRHPLNHRSPLRSNYTSPLMTTRQSIQAPHSETGYYTNKTVADEMQLQEAEAHINELNEEIKTLHDKIEFLQRNLEKNSLDNKKVKVTENIELIRLQRSLKQQAIQIASLQAQVKSSESNQKVLKEELAKAHKENDDALQVISEKQNEILNLCIKLEEKKLNKLEEDELKGRIEDLLKERDSLKERSDYLMKNIGSKDPESEKVNKLQKLLSEEKLKKEKLEETLELVKKNSDKNSVADNLMSDPPDPDITVDSPPKTPVVKTTVPEKHGTAIIIETSGGEFLCNKCKFSKRTCKCCQENALNPEVETDSEPTSESEKQNLQRCSSSSGEWEIEKMKMKCELQYLRQMLRNQTTRCEAQHVEICRLMCELKQNEEKFREALKSLDFHLKVFECLETQLKTATVEEKQPEQPREFGRRSTLAPDVRTLFPFRSGIFNRKSDAIKPFRPKTFTQKVQPVTPEEKGVFIEEEEEVEEEEETSKGESSLEQVGFANVRTQTVQLGSDFDKSTQTDSTNMSDFGMSVDMPTTKELEPVKEVEPTSEPVHVKEQLPVRDTELVELDPREFAKRRQSVSEETLSRAPKKAILVDSERGARFGETEPRKRFVEQKFLDSSDDDQKVEDGFKRDSFLSKVKSIDEDTGSKLKESRDEEGSEESDTRISTGIVPTKRRPMSKDSEDRVSVTIMWLKLEAGTALWSNTEVDMLFVDFTFLDLKGAETETPQSLPKPRRPDDICQFNFTKEISITGNRKKMMTSFMRNPDEEIMVFKVVSDSEKFDETNGECEDVGVATLLVREFLLSCNNGPFQLKVKNVTDHREIIGTLCLNIEASYSLLNIRK